MSIESYGKQPSEKSFTKSPISPRVTGTERHHSNS